MAEFNSSGSVTAINTFGAAGLISRNVTGYGNTLYAFDERTPPAAPDRHFWRKTHPKGTFGRAAASD